MTVKIILALALVVATTLGGLKLSEKYKFRRDLFAELSAFNAEFLSDIGYVRNSLEFKLAQSRGALKELLTKVKDKILSGEDFLLDKRLDASHKELIKNYFSSLGTSDEKGQREILRLYGERIKAMENSTNLDYQKFSKLYLRLGFSLGLGIVVIII